MIIYDKKKNMSVLIPKKYRKKLPFR